MRPGELVVAEAPAPKASAVRRARVSVRNTGRFPAYLGSHFDLTRASGSLELDRPALEGTRPDIPAGSTVRVAAGETVELAVIWD